MKQGKARKLFPLPSTRNLVFVKNPIRPKRRAPKVSKGRSESPLVASAEAKSSAKQGKARRVFPQPSTRILVFVTNPIRSKRRAPKVSKGRAESPLVASAEAKPSAKQGKARRVFPLPSTRNLVFVKNPIRPKRRAPKVSKGRSESPLVASAEAKPSAKQRKARRVFPQPSTRNLVFVTNPIRSKRRAPKVSKGRSESPLFASAEAKLSAKQRKARKVFPLPSTRSQFLVGGFVRLRADEVLSITGKYPKGAGGGQRVHVSWPPPDPPLLSYSAPLASQGRAQLGSRPSLGGPLSPSAQSIPPPAVGRRFIPGVVARYRHGRDTL